MKRRREAWGPFESDQDVLDWLDENPEMEKRVIEIQPLIGGGAFVVVRPDDSKGEA